MTKLIYLFLYMLGSTPILLFINRFYFNNGDKKLKEKRLARIIYFQIFFFTLIFIILRLVG